MGRRFQQSCTSDRISSPRFEHLTASAINVAHEREWTSREERGRLQFEIELVECSFGSDICIHIYVFDTVLLREKLTRSRA